MLSTETIRYSLRRAGLLPCKSHVSYEQRNDKSVQTTVSGRQVIGGRTVLQAVFEITAGGRIRLAYDELTGECLTIGNKRK